MRQPPDFSALRQQYLAGKAVCRSMRTFILLTILVASVASATACSAFRMATGDGWVVGCNEDAWRLTPHITWDASPGGLAICTTGSRRIGPGQFAPQSGMNEAGLVLTRLAAQTQPIPTHPSHHLPPIQDDAAFLIRLLRTCSTVAEAEDFAARFDRRRFLGDVLLVMDSTGATVVIEPYTFVHPAPDSPYLLSNFCPSVTSEPDRLALGRYRRGTELIARDEPFTPADLAETMSVHRARHGDGTLLTSLWHPSTLKVTLYFYHDFTHAVTIDLREAWAAGRTLEPIPSLFPPNPGFAHLRRHPSPHMFRFGPEFLAFLGFVLALLAFTWQIRGRQPWSLNLALAWTGAYAVLLAAHQPLWFFDLPYHHPQHAWLTAASASPWGILALFAAGLFAARRTPDHPSFLAKSIATLTLLAFLYGRFFPFF